MSTAVFPALAGLGWSVKRVPMWKTRVQEAISGKETRIADWSYPRWRWELAYDFLRGDAGHAEFQALAGFFNQRQGMFDSFLYQDADDFSAVGQQLGSGDGATQSFQLVRSLGGFIEPIIAPNVVSAVYLAGVAQSPSSYTVDAATGIVTFTIAPGAAVAITADFTFYFRCRFADDSMDLEKFMSQLWRAKKLAFISVKST
jgi:uncharacterized protein (TIGR02217 family)